MTRHPSPLHLASPADAPPLGRQPATSGPDGTSSDPGPGADVSLLGATAMGLVIAPRPDAPAVLARLAARSSASLAQARAWVLATDVMPVPTRQQAAALLDRARQHGPDRSAATA